MGRKKSDHKNFGRSVITEGLDFSEKNPTPSRLSRKLSRIFGFAFFVALFAIIGGNLFFAKSAGAADGSFSNLITQCSSAGGTSYGVDGINRTKVTPSNYGNYAKYICVLNDKNSCNSAKDKIAARVVPISSTECEISVENNADQINAVANFLSGLSTSNAQNQTELDPTDPTAPPKSCPAGWDPVGQLPPGQSVTVNGHIYQNNGGTADSPSCRDPQTSTNAPKTCGSDITQCSTSSECIAAGHTPEDCAKYTFDGNGGEKNSPTACNSGGGLGFIICPLMTMLSKAIDSVYGILTKILEIPATIFSDPTVSAAFKTFLPFANIVLAIIFLVIIYSEATGNGFGALSNYGIKKTLPRLIIFAVLINISFYICAAAVDLSNIAGSGMYKLFTGTSKDMDHNFADQTSNMLQQGDGN